MLEMLRRLWPMIAPFLVVRLKTRLQARAARRGAELLDDDALALAAMIIEGIADLLDGDDTVDADTTRKATALIAAMREPT